MYDYQCICEREDLGYNLPDLRARYCEYFAEDEVDGKETCDDVMVITITIKRTYGSCPSCCDGFIETRIEFIVECKDNEYGFKASCLDMNQAHAVAQAAFPNAELDKDYERSISRSQGCYYYEF